MVEKLEFNELLKKSRVEHGMTQQQVADKIGIDKSTYCGYETGKRQPDPRRIVQIAKALGVMQIYRIAISVSLFRSGKSSVLGLHRENSAYANFFGFSWLLM